MTTIRTAIALTALLTGPLFAQAGTLSTTVPVGLPIPPATETCGTVAADKTVTVKPDTDKAVQSGNSAYYYAHPACRRFVVDFKVKPQTTSWSYRTLNGKAYNLPGAVVTCATSGILTCDNLDRSMPSNSTDCGAYEKRVSFYTKAKGSRAMTFLRSVTIKGQWIGGRCVESAPATAQDVLYGLALDNGFEGTARVAVAVLVDKVPQKVSAGLAIGQVIR